MVTSWYAKEETFPIPLKYIDVSKGSQHKSACVARKRIDDSWIVDANLGLSDSWKGFTKFTKKPPREKGGPGETNKNSSNYQT